MCPHVDQVTWSTRRYRSGARNGSVTHVDWHFASLTAVGQEAEGDEEERQSTEKMPSDRSQKGGKGPKGGGRPGGPCWTCGEPHIQRESPHAWAGKGNYPFTTAWSSWRPRHIFGTIGSSSWLPKPKGKAKTKEEKDIPKAREKDT